MILDGHIHLRTDATDVQAFAERLAAAGVSGGVLISLPPPGYRSGQPLAAADERLAHVLGWCAGAERLYPFFWLDPLEPDAVTQVERAAGEEIAGFKIICDRFEPGDARAMPAYRAIADTGRPVLFHSGILWDGKPSSPFNRPAAFEPLLAVPGLRFALAHIGWPWCDELIAVYGKFLNAADGGSDKAVELFVDTTPGTPPIYRREALARLFTVGYDVAHRVMFGTDSNPHDYNVGWLREWVERDRTILAELGVDVATIEAVFAHNLERFLGLKPGVVPRSVRPGE